MVFYDHVVASRLYNRAVWGTTPDDYAAFDERALGTRARRRLDRLCGPVPEHLVLCQGDVFDLPFETSAFATVSCSAVIHGFDDPAQAVRQLIRVLAPGGNLFLTSLVTVPGRPLEHDHEQAVWPHGDGGHAAGRNRLGAVSHFAVRAAAPIE